MQLTDLFEGLSGIVRRDRVIIDNFVFQLHTKFTVGLLISLCLVVTAIQYFGTPIDCIGDYKSVPRNIFNLYCWSATTYSLPAHWDDAIGSEIPYPGIANSDNSEDRVYHSYYQWVWFVLCIQALCFYIPKFIWKSVESDRTASLLMELDQHIMTEAEREKRCRALVKYLVSTKGKHGQFFWTFFSLEILNVVNLIFQIWLLNVFIGGQFLNIGPTYMYSSYDDVEHDPLYNPLIKIFPRMTKCTFRRVGPSGDIVKNDAMCLLSVNHVHEKVFVILWFWFLMLLVFSVIAVACRFWVIFSKDCRIMSLQTTNRLLPSHLLKQIVSRTSLGDWFLLYLLAKNMEAFNFKILAQNFHRDIRRHCSRSDDVSLETNLSHSKECLGGVCNCQDFEGKTPPV